MQTKIESKNGCLRVISIEVSAQELKSQFDQVYQDIRKHARIPGFRPGKAPLDLLQTHYSKRAEEDVIRRAIPQFYLKAIKQEQLSPVAPPEIESVQLKGGVLQFKARVDVRPQLKLKSYKNLKLTKKKIDIDPGERDKILERLQKDKNKTPDQLAKDLGFSKFEDLKTAIDQDLVARAQAQVQADLKRQMLEQLLQRASLDVPQSVVDSQREEILKQLKMNRILQGENKVQVEAKQEQLQEQARKEAVRRVKLSFILEEIAQRENIQVQENDLNNKINELAQHSGKSEDQVREYLGKENLISGLQSELKTKKTIAFLLSVSTIN